jgi:hypothetical protein
MINFFKSKFLYLNKSYNLRTNIFLVGIFLIYLDSYVILDIPLPWMGLFLCIVSCINNQIMPYRKLLWSMFLLILILIVTTSVNYEQNVASLDFILLRFFNIIGLVIIINYFAIQNTQNSVHLTFEKNLVNIGFFFSIIAIIVFFFHKFGIQEINIIDLLRNRLTTGAGKIYPIGQDYNFDPGNYKFYRAVGTFREPSLLVNALILPFFLAIKNQKFFAILVIGICIYLTYSLAIWFALLFGVTFSLLIIYRLKFFSKYLILGTFFVIFLIYIIYTYGFIDSNVYYQRILHLAENDSRDYIYKNLDVIMGGNYWFGNGVGFGFFNLTEHIFGNTLVPTSFLSVPLNYWSAGGIMGLIIILIWISFHNLATLIYLKGFNKNLYLILSPLNVFFILYLSSFEEPHIWHAICLGYYLSYLSANKKEITNDHIKN